MKIKAAELSLSLEYGKGWRLSALISDDKSIAAAKKLVDRLRDAVIGLDIDKWRERRSLDANAYAWLLIDKIAAATSVGKAVVYRNAIRDIGGVSEVVCVVAAGADKLCRSWEHKGLGWQAERSDSKIAGCVNVTLWYGSSVYDTRQMAALIDHIVQDAEALGIDTMTPQERQRLLDAWEARYAKQTDKSA